MKRLIGLLLALILVFSFAACSDDHSDNGGDNDDIIELDPDLNIGEDGEINFPIIPVKPD